jgi:peptidoglycan hydrolase CwlO-like protein
MTKLSLYNSQYGNTDLFISNMNDFYSNIKKEVERYRNDISEAQSKFNEYKHCKNSECESASYLYTEYKKDLKEAKDWLKKMSWMLERYDSEKDTYKKLRNLSYTQFLELEKDYLI